MTQQPTFTVITPTYNRVQTLPRVLRGLRSQTFRDFEWLIVLDGSPSALREMVHGWRDAEHLTIRCVELPHNQGLQAALNRGVDAARGRLVVLHADDDTCVPQALERFNFHWDSLSPDQRSRYVGITALCNDQHGNPVGPCLPVSPLDSDTLEMFYRYKLRDEMWGCQRTDVLRQHPFPEVWGMSQGSVWFDIARHYKTRFVTERLRTYYIDEPDRSDQLSRHVSLSKAAKGSALMQEYCLNRNMDWFFSDPRSFLRAAALYVRFSLHARRSAGEIVSKLNSSTARALVLAMAPAGIGAFLLDQLRDRLTA